MDPSRHQPWVLHDFEPRVVFDLEPVDAVTVTTLMDNVTDVFMPDQGPARRPPGLAGGRRPAATMEGGDAPEALLAEHGFSVLVTVSRNGAQHHILFDAGASPDGVVENMRRLRGRPVGHRGHRVQPRPLRPHHRARRADPPAGHGEPAGAHPPAVLAPPPGGDPRPRPAGDPDDEPPGSDRRRLRGDRGTAAQLPVRPVRPGDRRGAPHHRLRAGVPAAAGLARRPLGAGPAGPRRPGPHRRHQGQGTAGDHRLRPRRGRQHLPLRPAADQAGPCTR